MTDIKIQIEVDRNISARRYEIRAIGRHAITVAEVPVHVVREMLSDEMDRFMKAVAKECEDRCRELDESLATMYGLQD